MDRCHRIGQTKPVHVYRLATAQSVEVTWWLVTIIRSYSNHLAYNFLRILCWQGRMLKRAFSKLKLEHVVIGKGQFQLEKTKPTNADALEVCLLVLMLKIY